MSTRKIQNPFTGWPEITPFRQEIGFTIKARHHTPKRIYFRRRVYGCAFFVLVIGTFGVPLIPREIAISLSGALIPTIFLPVWKKTTWLRITPKEMQLKTLRGWKSFTQPLFSIEVTTHLKAQPGKKDAYQDSYSVWAEYFGETHLICDFYDPKGKKIRKFFDRLSTVNELMTSQEFIRYWAELGECPFSGSAHARPSGQHYQDHRRTHDHNEQNRSRNEKRQDTREDASGMSYKQALRFFDLQEEDGLTFDMLKKKVRIFRSKFHPDKGEGSTFIMQQINQAYEVIRKQKGW